MSSPLVSLIVATYQLPAHLRRVLVSAASQTVASQIEIIVTDDGSTDSTAQVVADFAREFSRVSTRPVQFITRPRQGFHLTRCRNDGARVATAPYLLFLDGDCVLPRDHIEKHLAARRRGVVHFGYCCRLTPQESDLVTEDLIRTGNISELGSQQELAKLRSIHLKSLFYQWIGHRTKPALKGGNIGIWKSDYERVNGFDENFRDWGCEDDDLSHRVRAAGLKVESILGHTRTYHLWHPPASSKPSTKWSAGSNVAYLKRRGRLSRCSNGLVKRNLRDLHVSVAGTPADARTANLFVDRAFGGRSSGSESVEVELLFWPGTGKFSSKAECNVLVTDSQPPQSLARAADVVVATSSAGIKSLEEFLCKRPTADQIASHAAA